jgi:hypothetical protein
VKDAKDLIPWAVTDISLRPYDGYWSMNPSIHFDGSTWRCVLRCTDYAMPNGHTIRSSKARPAGNQSKNAMVVLDPEAWRPVQIFKMHEYDGEVRTPCANVGFEDMRIFRTDRGGLQGIAASLHLRRDGRPADGGPHNQPPEQVLLSFDAEYNVVAARPIRGDWWSGKPQKNWVPFDDCLEPRFLYSIGDGTMFDERGAVHGDAAVARPSATARPISSSAQPASAREGEERERREREEQERSERDAREQEEREERERREQAEREERERKERDRKREKDRPRDLRARLPIRGTDVSLVRGRRTSAPAASARSASPGGHHAIGSRGGNVGDSTRVLGTGRTLPPRYEGLRGGTQLVRVGEDAWLGIGHEMRFLKGLKYYWHTWYVVDSRGKMTAASEPMKLASNGIEFAAGIAIADDRVVVSFGVDDMECKIGETRLGAVMETLRPVER